MGCMQSMTEEARANKRIETAQASAKEDFLHTVRILLIGTGDSGKTTLRKQLSNIHNKKLERENTRKELRPTILSNLLEGVVLIQSNLGKEDDELLKQARALLKNEEELTCFTPEFALKLKECMENPEFRLQEKIIRPLLYDSWDTFSSEFLTNSTSWGSSGWIPTSNDCIRARARTTGVVREVIEIDHISFELYDAGGQRAERRKWLHSFENVSNIIFMTAISEYDQVLFEDAKKNRLQEALELFSEAANSTWLKNAKIMLFLNKRDLFHRKFIQDKIPLNISGLFPSAPTDNTNEEAALKWIEDQFRNLIMDKKKPILVHVTSAVDPVNVQLVFDMCKQVLLEEALGRHGFGL